MQGDAELFLGAMKALRAVAKPSLPSGDGYPPPPIDPPQTEPQEPSMEGRVARLEAGVQDIKADLKAVRTDVADIKMSLIRIESRFEIIEAQMSGRFGALEGRLQGIEGRFSSLPTSLQLFGFAIAVLMAAGIMRYFEPRIANLAAPQITTAPRAP